MKIDLPYGKGTIGLNLEGKRVKAVLRSKAHDFHEAKSSAEMVREALEDPIGAKRLRHLAISAERVLIVTSDHTRPVPSKITLPLFLAELRSLNPKVQVKIIIATGFHRLTNQAEMLAKFGPEIVGAEELVVHDSRDQSQMVFKGTLPSGGELWLNSLVDWADLVIAEGFIEPHFFAGFSGGRKSILPGIAAARTVLANHCAKFIASDEARAGKLDDNPIHHDMQYAAEAARLSFILNVVLGSDQQVIRAFAGDPVQAHRSGCEFVRQLAAVKAEKAEIVITSNGGYPLDQNIYQAVKGMTAAEACIKDGGVIIMAAACNDGHGGEAFYHWFADVESPAQVAKKIQGIPPEATIADQWEAQILARVMLKAKVILVSDQCNPKIVRDMHLLHAPNLETALQMAEEIVGGQAELTVIPDGVGVIVE